MLLWHLKIYLFLHQITDGTLIQLSIHCPRLQVLVSVCVCVWLPVLLHLQAPRRRYSSNGALVSALLVESVSLWADHWWRHPTPRQWPLRSRPSWGDRARQLPTDHRRLAGAPEELPQPGSHRALWLPADHPRWHQETTGECGGLITSL